MDVAYWIGGIALLAFFGWQLELHYDSGAAFLGVMLVLIALLNAQHIVALTSNMSKRLGGP